MIPPPPQPSTRARLQTPYEECPAIGSVYMKIVKGDMPDAFAAVEDPELASFIASCLKPDAETPSATELLRSGASADGGATAYMMGACAWRLDKGVGLLMTGRAL